VCDLETSRMGAPYIYIYNISRLRVKWYDEKFSSRRPGFILWPVRTELAVDENPTGKGSSPSISVFHSRHFSIDTQHFLFHRSPLLYNHVY